MESEKPGFSEDDDHHRRNPEKIEEIVEPSSKRSYECVFCKRGFTNAQALGGHMNIHRRDRSKSSSSSSSKQVLNPSISNPNPSPAPVTRVTTAGSFLFEKSDHDVPDSWDQALRSKLSPILTHADATKYPVIVSSSNFGRFGEKLGSDLTLQIGSSCPNNKNEEIAANSDEEMEDDIDLELRLGRPHH